SVRGGRLATVPRALYAQSPGAGAEDGAGEGRRGGAYDLPAGGSDGSPAPTPGRLRKSAREVPPRGGAVGGGRGRGLHVLRLPGGASAADLQHESAGAAQQRAEAAQRGGRDLPESGGRHPVAGRAADGAERRMAGGPALFQRDLDAQATPPAAG